MFDFILMSIIMISYKNVHKTSMKEYWGDKSPQFKVISHLPGVI